MKKTSIASAVALALSVGAAGNANAAAITSITISDVWDSQTTINAKFNTVGGVLGTDGSAGRFGFNAGTTSLWTGDTGTDMAWGGATQGPGVFTTGFIFAGSAFQPDTYGGGAVGDITGGVLSVSTLDFGGYYTGATFQFNLPPDAGTLKTNFIQDIGGGDYAVAFSWSHYITSAEDPSFNYVGFTANWIIEGVAHTAGAPQVPVPPAAWLMGSGLVGLAGVARRRKNKNKA